MEREQRRFLYIWLLPHITLYQNRYNIASLHTIAFFDTHVSINNPYWQSSGIMKVVQILHNYIRYTDRLLDCLLVVGSLVASNIVRASWKIKKKRLTYRKKYIEEFVWVKSLFCLHALPLLMSFFVAFFVYYHPFVYFLLYKIVGGERVRWGSSAPCPQPPVSKALVGDFHKDLWDMIEYLDSFLLYYCVHEIFNEDLLTFSLLPKSAKFIFT